MSAQDRTEQVLREIHILLSRCEVYDKATNRIIVNKKDILELLSRLNVCIYNMMEEYELTQQGRDAAEREFRKRGDEIIVDASGKAEDVYAASVLYTDEALRRVQDIMQAAADSAKEVYDRINQELQKEKAIVQRDQSELKGHLQDLKDTDKYLKLIEERNKEIKKEKEKAEKEQEPSIYAAVKPEIKINAEYFERVGILPEPEMSEMELHEEEFPEEKPEPVVPEINVNLDAEYFKWKEDAAGEKEPEKKPEKHSLIGKILK